LSPKAAHTPFPGTLAGPLDALDAADTWPRCHLPGHRVQVVEGQLLRANMAAAAREAQYCRIVSSIR